MIIQTLRSSPVVRTNRFSLHWQHPRATVFTSPCNIILRMTYFRAFSAKRKHFKIEKLRFDTLSWDIFPQPPARIVQHALASLNYLESVSRDAGLFDVSVCSVKLCSHWDQIEDWDAYFHSAGENWFSGITVIIVFFLFIGVSVWQGVILKMVFPLDTSLFPLDLVILPCVWELHNFLSEGACQV